MIFSYESAVREYQRGGGARCGLALKKRWYGWVVVDTGRVWNVPPPKDTIAEGVQIDEPRPTDTGFRDCPSGRTL